MDKIRLRDRDTGEVIAESEFSETTPTKWRINERERKKLVERTRRKRRQQKSKERAMKDG